MSAYSNAVLALNPSSYWRFTGTTPLADSGSGGITLTAIGAPIRGSSIIPSEGVVADSSYNVTASQYFTAGDNYEFVGVDMTLAIWFRVDSSTFGSGFQRLLEKRDPGGTNPGWLLFGSGAGAVSFNVDFGATEAGFTGQVGADFGEVHFVVLTHVNATQTTTMYADGVSIGAKDDWATPPFPASGTAAFAIGATSDGQLGFIGGVDDVAVWSGTALTATQVANLYAAGGYQPRPAMTSRGTSW